MTVERDIKIIEAILFASGEPVLEDDLKVKIINTKYFDSYIGYDSPGIKSSKSQIAGKKYLTLSSNGSSKSQRPLLLISSNFSPLSYWLFA